MNELANRISDEIRETGPITFARFMELALYCPNYGYYQRQGDIIGRRGDYYTSVSVGNLFGELLAFEFAGWLRDPAISGAGGESEQSFKARGIVEAGADRGDLAKDILAWMRKHQPEMFGGLHYFIVEPLSGRRSVQRQTLAEFAGKVMWVDNIDEVKPAGAPNASSGASGFRGIIFSNELLDAMPVHRFGWDAGRQSWYELGVALESERFVWKRLADFLPPCFGTEYIDLWPALPDGFIVEWCPAALEWWRKASNALGHGKLVTIDYGLSGAEVFAPERREGTLRTYHKHRLGGDVLALPGEVDITAHVNFTAIRAVGESAGLETNAYESQAQFLTKIAARSQAEGFDFDLRGKRAREFQTLIHPEHLGRAFRVLVQSRT